MFEQASRYFEIENASVAGQDRDIITYKKRRFLPREKISLSDLVMTAGDRLDLIAARTLGDPEQYWMICDANDIMHPLELTDVVGQVIHIPLPGR